MKWKEQACLHFLLWLIFFLGSPECSVDASPDYSVVASSEFFYVATTESSGSASPEPSVT